MSDNLRKSEDERLRMVREAVDRILAEAEEARRALSDEERAAEDERLAAEAEASLERIRQMLDGRKSAKPATARKSRADRMGRRAEASARLAKGDVIYGHFGRGSHDPGYDDDADDGAARAALEELIDQLVMAPTDPEAADPQDRADADRNYDRLVDEIDEVEAAIREMLDGDRPVTSANVDRLRGMIERIERSALGAFAEWSEVRAALDAAARNTKSAAALGAKGDVVYGHFGTDEPVASVEEFMRSEVIEDDGSSVTVEALYQAYADWASRNGETPMSEDDFKDAMRETGIRNGRIAGRDRYVGITMKSAAPLAAKSRGAHAVYG